MISQLRFWVRTPKFLKAEARGFVCTPVLMTALVTRGENAEAAPGSPARRAGDEVQCTQAKERLGLPWENIWKQVAARMRLEDCSTKCQSQEDVYCVHEVLRVVLTEIM